MKRREFLKKAGMVAASASLSPLMFSKAQARRFRFGMVTSWPTSLDAIYGNAVRMAESLREMTDGDLEVTVYPAGAEVGALEVYDAVSSGAFEMGHTAAYYYIGKEPSHGFFTSVPFGMNAQQMNAWFYFGGGIELWNELNARDDLIAFPAGNTGVQMAGWFRREINSAADLQGLTMRIPGLGGQVVSRVGVNVQNIPAGELFLALDTGVVDAAEWVGPHDDEILGLNRAATFYYGPGWQEPGPALGTYVNLTLFNSLPADIQEAIRSASAAINVKMLADYDSKNGQALRRLVEGGTQLRTLPESVLATFREATERLHAEFSAQSSFYARVYAAYTEFQDSVREWTVQSEHAYNSVIFN